MRIDPKKLEALLSMSDDGLWREIVSVGARHGFKIPEKTPPREEMEKLRNACKGGRINTASALKIIDSYRKGKA